MTPDPPLISELLELGIDFIEGELRIIAQARFDKLEIVSKLWIAFGCDMKAIPSEIFYTCIDLGLIPKETALSVNYGSYVNSLRYLSSLPEIAEYEPERASNESIPPKQFVENQWALFKLLRRSFQFTPLTSFIYKDDVETLKTIDSKKLKLQFDLYLKEALHFGAIECTKYLHDNMPQDVDTNMLNKALEIACDSGNEELVRYLESLGFQHNAASFEAAVYSRNNRLARSIIDVGVTPTLHEPACSFNVGMLLYCASKGADVNGRDEVLYSFSFKTLFIYST